MARGNLPIGLAAAALGVLTIVLYSAGLSGPFVFDDAPNITLNLRLTIDSLDPESLWRAALSGNSGPIQRPLSMLSFALNYYIAGADPYYFKLVNLAIHLLGALGFGILGYLLIGTIPDVAVSRRARAWIALAAAGAWVLHPLNLTSVLYVVQRMTGLASLWMVWGMVFYVTGRLHQQQGRNGWALILTGIFGFGSLAVLSKETGALLPLYLLAIEWCLFRFAAPHARTRHLLEMLYAGTVLLPMAVTITILVYQPGYLTGGYAIRDYTLDERLLTEARVLLWYLRQILLPDITQMGLLLDDIPISRSLTDPPTTLPALLGVAALIAMAFQIRNRWPLMSLGILWFFAGHALESTFPALEIAYEHRNYLPAYGILLAAFWHLLHPESSRPKLRVGIAGAWLVLTAVSLHARVGHWSSEESWALTEVEYHPNSPRSQYLAGAQYQALAASSSSQRDEYFALARGHFEHALTLNPRLANIWIAMIPLHQRGGRPLPPNLLDRIETALQTAPFEPSHANAIANLTNCLVDKICSLSEHEYRRLIMSALQNPTLNGRFRANVLLYASSYFATARKDYREALALIDQAIAISPDWITYRLARLKWLIFAADYSSARKELSEIKNRDSLGLFRREVHEIEENLPELKPSEKTSS